MIIITLEVDIKDFLLQIWLFHWIIYFRSKYPPDMRFHSVLFVAEDDNILQPRHIQQVAKKLDRFIVSYDKIYR